MEGVFIKPACEEWLHWAQVAVDRLTTCVHTYSKPPHMDVFMSDEERQAKNGDTLDLLRRLHRQIEAAESESPARPTAAQDETFIQELSLLLHETLRRLPLLSEDMQKLLKSPWFEKCNGRLATELFCGPMGRESEGIGSGQPAHGRLPQQLEALFEREQMGDSRPPRVATESHPHRHDETHRRWADNNTRFLRSAGRVE